MEKGSRVSTLEINYTAAFRYIDSYSYHTSHHRHHELSQELLTVEGSTSGSFIRDEIQGHDLTLAHGSAITYRWLCRVYIDTPSRRIALISHIAYSKR